MKGSEQKRENQMQYVFTGVRAAEVENTRVHVEAAVIDTLEQDGGYSPKSNG